MVGRWIVIDQAGIAELVDRRLVARAESAFEARDDFDGVRHFLCLAFLLCGCLGGWVQAAIGSSAGSAWVDLWRRDGAMPSALTAARTAKAVHAQSAGLNPAVTLSGLPKWP